MEVTGRGGRATGKNKDYFNVKETNGTARGMFLDKVEWKKDKYAFNTRLVMEDKNTLKIVQNDDQVIEDVHMVLIPTKEHNSPECIAAKKRETNAFKQFGVYQKVEDRRQVRLSSRWVLTNKLTVLDIEKNERKVKARLVCRGFKETIEVQSDIGLNIESTAKGITLDQIEYMKERFEPAILRGGDNKRPLEKEEMTLLRRLTGKINWAALQTRPDLSYLVLELSTKFKKVELNDLKKANKVINRLADNPDHRRALPSGVQRCSFPEPAGPDRIRARSCHHASRRKT